MKTEDELLGLIAKTNSLGDIGYVQNTDRCLFETLKNEFFEPRIENILNLHNDN